MSNVLQFKVAPPVVGIVQCADCHGDIDADARFCKHCGNRVKAVKVTKKQKYAPKKKHTKKPLRTPDEIAAMQKVLATPTSDKESKAAIARRNFTLFNLGISLGLRSSDLTVLQVSHFFTADMNPRPQLHVIEIKTGKEQNIDIDQKISDMLREYVAELGLEYDDYLAVSQRERDVGDYAGAKILTPHSWNRIIATAAESLGWNKEFYGGHSLRKTFAYNFYRNAMEVGKEHGYRALAMLCRRFNHASEAVTLCYIGIEQDEVMKVCKLTTDQYNLVYEQALAFENGDKDEDV